MRIRIKFSKKEDARYLGHLDIMRFFQRCFNRAGIAMEYSAGYNPHQKMSFAQPLGVGLTSSGEYLDAEVANGQEPQEICTALNRVCGSGFFINSVREVKEGAQKAMASVCFARYTVTFENPSFSEEALAACVDTILKSKSLIILKKTKKGEKETDIRPMICSLSCSGVCLHMDVTAGSEHNLKPEQLLMVMSEKSGIAYSEELHTINREDLFAQDWISLEQFQTI